MSQLHFLNVGQGDCTWIKHADGKNTVIDICNGHAAAKQSLLEDLLRDLMEENERRKGTCGNFQQKKYPANPIEYLKSFGETSIHRFILTHPDMDHMDGLVPLFEEFAPANFWDTENCKELDSFNEVRYSRQDWEFYKELRSGRLNAAKRLTLYSGARGKYYNCNEDGTGGGNGLHVLAPTRKIVSAANAKGDFNDCSYVLLYRTFNGKRVVIGGDSHDVSWEHILSAHRKDVEDVDLLIAPHHGRKSDRSYDFLDVLRPKLTFFGVAPSEHLGYSAWQNRGLEVMTNNQGNCFVIDFVADRGDVYCTNESFAHAYFNEKLGRDSVKNDSFRAWYLRYI